MKRLATVTAALLLCAVPLFSHHAAEGTIDQEIYEMIDALVADTPHALWTPPEEMGEGVWEMSLSTRTARQFESMIDDGLLDYLAMLDGEVLITMTFNRRGGIEMTIVQVKEEE